MNYGKSWSGFFPTPDDVARMMMKEETPKEVVISEAMFNHMSTVVGGVWHVQSDEQLMAGDLVEFLAGINSRRLARLVTVEDPPPNIRMMNGHQIITFNHVTKRVLYDEQRTNLANHIAETFGVPFKPGTPAVEVCWHCHRRVETPHLAIILDTHAPHGERYSIKCPHCRSVVIGSSSEEVVLRWNSSAALNASTMVFYDRALVACDLFMVVGDDATMLGRQLVEVIDGSSERSQDFID